MASYFPSTYEDSRTRFLQSLILIQQKWHSTQLESHPLKNHPDLSIDWLWAHPKQKENLIIISTAEHGIEYQESTRLTIELYRRALDEYQSVIQIDMHTGYGPRCQMSIIVSPLDSTTSTELSKKINYPLVMKIDADEFYEISGDTGEYYYKLRNEHFPDKHLFACGFEFGTFGDSLPARIRSLKAMVFENQLHWHAAKDNKTAERIRHEFGELYFPAEIEWREKALADGRQAFDGILRAYGLY